MWGPDVLGTNRNFSTALLYVVLERHASDRIGGNMDFYRHRFLSLVVYKVIIIIIIIIIIINLQEFSFYNINLI